MSDINSVLNSMENGDEKEGYLYALFNKVKKKVDDVLLFGPSNSGAAHRAANIYHFSKRNPDSLFPVRYSKLELMALPAAIANSKQIGARTSTRKSVYELYESYLEQAYVYGTGTCELYAIVGAYFLATEHEMDVSIETIFSNNSHTYIRLNTNPEYIMDFWGSFCCEYGNTKDWNDCLGSDYIRNEGAQFRTELQLNSAQLIEMGSRVFTEHKEDFRMKVHEDIMQLAGAEIAVDQAEKSISDDRTMTQNIP